MAAKYREEFYLDKEFLFSTEELFEQDPDDRQAYFALDRAYSTRAKFASVAGRIPDTIEIRVRRLEPPGQGGMYVRAS